MMAAVLSVLGPPVLLFYAFTLLYRQTLTHEELMREMMGEEVIKPTPGELVLLDLQRWLTMRTLVCIGMIVFLWASTYVAN